MTGTLTVVGSGKLDVEPDGIIISGSISRRSSDHSEAISDSVSALSVLRDAVSSHGFSPDVLRTTSISVSPVYATRQDDGVSRSVQDGYEATQGYRMEIPLDNDALDRALDAMEVAGPSGFSVSYIVREGEGHQAEARRLAVMDAIAKAESLADAAGVRLGPISRIDHSDGGHRPIMYSRAMNSDYVPESVEFSDSVTMEWVIA